MIMGFCNIVIDEGKVVRVMSDRDKDFQAIDDFLNAVSYIVAYEKEAIIRAILGQEIHRKHFCMSDYEFHWRDHMDRGYSTLMVKDKPVVNFYAPDITPHRLCLERKITILVERHSKCPKQYYKLFNGVMKWDIPMKDK